MLRAAAKEPSKSKQNGNGGPRASPTPDKIAVNPVWQQLATQVPLPSQATQLLSKPDDSKDAGNTAAIQASSGVPRSEDDAAQINKASEVGTSGPSGALPFLSQIQSSFGPYDLSRVKAHLDSAAVEGATAMSAEAFTKGDHVAFAGPPSLRTAAHEAAHVIQQQAGVQLDRGVGQAGDRYEQHADAVAERVMHGHSSQDLLDSYVSEAQSPSPVGDANLNVGGAATRTGIERHEAESNQIPKGTPDRVPHPNSAGGPGKNGNAGEGHAGASGVVVGTRNSGASAVARSLRSQNGTAGVAGEWEQTTGAIAGQFGPALGNPFGGAPPAVQRAPPGGPTTKPVAGAVMEERVGDITFRIWESEGLMSASLAGEPWVTIRWTPGSGKLSKIGVAQQDFPAGFGIDISASFDLRITIDTSVEAAYALRQVGGATFTHKYTARGRRVAVNQHLPEGEVVDGYSKVNKYEAHDIPIIHDLELRRAPPPPKLKEPPPFWWEFDRIEQLDLFAAAHPSYYWIALRPAKGERFRAVSLTEKNLQQGAQRFREDPDVAASIFRLYENGTAWPDLDPLYYMFFAYPTQAKMGAPGDAPECIIFTHGKESYGRKALTHDEALNQWQILEMLDTSAGSFAVETLDIDGLGQFFELVVAGKTHTWEIGVYYFEKRDVFLANAHQLKNDEGLDWDDLFEEDFDVWEVYLRRALDRDEAAIDPELAGIIDTDSDFVSAAGPRVYDRVEEFAWHTALNAIGTARESVGIYLDSEKLRGLVLQFPFMTAKERNDSLVFIGVNPFLVPLIVFILRNPEYSQFIAMGETMYGVSLAMLRAAAAARFAELKGAYDSILNQQSNILLMEGEFGDQVREITYLQFGFKLNPRSYPHEGEAEQRSEAGGARMGPEYSVYGSEAGFIFAQEAAARASRERTMKYILIGVVVVASVVLVIASAGAGAALAGLAFSAQTTASFIAFTVTEVLISAAIVTAVGPGLNTFIMSGGSLDLELYKKAYAGIGWQFLLNAATFGFFKGLSIAIEAAAIAGAGGKEAYLASGAWKTANSVARIGVSASAMFAISMVTRRLETGKWPEGESLAEILFETGLSMLLLELGSYMARPAMQRIQNWSETQRIGAGVVDQMKNLRLEVTALNREAAKFGAEPLGNKKVGMELLARQEGLLKQQQQVLEQLQKSFRTRPDAEALSKELSGEMAEISSRLAEIRGARAFGNAEVRPAAAGGTGKVAEFTYKRGREQDLKDYFGKENVLTVGDHLEVNVGGKTLIFRPATNVDAGILPNATRNPDALQAWRSTATSRIRQILDRAAKTAADDPALREVTKADPASMDAAALRAFEKQLLKAEKALDKLEKKGPTTPIEIDRAGTPTDSWRLRLVAERERLMNRAKLLGLESEPIVETMRNHPMNRSGLKENTLENYRDTIEQVRKLLDQAQKAKLQALDMATGGPPVDVKILQGKLSARRADVLSRAKLFGTGDSAYIEAVKSLSVGGTEKLSSLTKAEQTIAAAEAKLDALAKKALEKAVVKHGADLIAEVRAGAGLEKLTDAQVGDVMRQLSASGPLSAEALRGAMLASSAADATSPISLKRAVSLARNAAELDYVLTTFGMLRDAQVGGSSKLMRDAVAGADKWQGAVWTMKLARMVIGIDKIHAFEVPNTTATGGRITDILLHSGRVIEAKDWRTWMPEKVQDQFFKDLEINTKNGTDPAGLEKIHWMFGDPPPVSLADIRATMRTALEDFIVKKGLTKNEADALRDAFDAHTKLVEAPKLGVPTVKPPVKSKSPIHTPPPPPKDDEK